MKAKSKHNRAMAVRCKVCGIRSDVKIRCGGLACSPCKRFFVRNSTKFETIKCLSGKFDCLTNAASLYNRTVTTCNGTTLRLICQRCRLTRCLEAGMVTETSSVQPADVMKKTDVEQELRSDSSSSFPAEPNHVGQNNAEVQYLFEKEYRLLTTIEAYFKKLEQSKNIPAIIAVLSELHDIHHFAQTTSTDLPTANRDATIARIFKLERIVRFVEQNTHFTS